MAAADSCASRRQQRRRPDSRWRIGCLGCCLAVVAAALSAATTPASAAAMMASSASSSSASVSAQTFLGDFGGPGCRCRPQNPQHPQQALCASQFALKVKVLLQLRHNLLLVADSRASHDRYLVAVKGVYRNTVRRAELKRGRRIHLRIPGVSDPCGMVTVRQPGASIVSRHLMKRRSYLVTGNIDDEGQLALSVCSWIAFWPTKSERNRGGGGGGGGDGGGDFAGNRMSKSQSRYLRSGVYARDCQRCRVLDGPHRKSDTGGDASNHTAVCQFNSGQDYNACFASHAYCAHYTNPYTGTGECEWHTASLRRYRRCVDQNLQIEARRLGITG